MTAAQHISPTRARAMITERLAPKPAPAASLGETLIRLGRLDRDAIERIEKARRGAPFGKTALRLGLLSRADLEFGLGVHLGFLHETTERVAIPAPLAIIRNPYSRQAEEFRALRTRLVSGLDIEALSMIAVTGADAKADALSTALNLAAAFAQLGRKTLLVDANLRRPSLARIFGEPRSVGLTEAVNGLASFEGAARGTLARNLDLLGAGAAAPDSQRVLAGKNFKTIIERAASEYETVMILTSPYGPSADCELVWAVASSVLVAVKKDESRSANLEQLRQSVRRTHAVIAGAVLTS